MELREKLVELRMVLGKLESLMVAYSGGTDSAFLAYEAHEMMGERMLAVIADSPSLPRGELAAALEFAAEHGIPVHILQTRELDDPNYARNDSDRCFHCKDELFTQMEAAREKLGFAQIAYGRNLDDDGDLRHFENSLRAADLVGPALGEVCRLRSIRQGEIHEANRNCWRTGARARPGRLRHARPRRQYQRQLDSHVDEQRG